METGATCAAQTSGGSVPLVALLGRTEAAFIAEFDRRIAQSEFSALSLAHSRNVLRHLASGPLRPSQIVGHCDVSKQAVSQQIAHLEAAGYVRVDDDPSDNRARVVSLTERGVRAQCLTKQLFTQIEADWAAALGEADLAQAREVLTRALDLFAREAVSAPC